MTKEAALHQFFNSFGIPFYPVASVPDDAQFPWGTYELITSAWLEGKVSLTVNLWYYTTDEEPPNAKAREMSEAIGMGGKILRCDGGAIWLKRGAPWCRSLRDAADPRIKRRYINVTAEYVTMD